MRSLTGEEAATAAGLRAAAEATLRAWPEARAVLLYGSRAAGEPRPESDWDIALVTRTARDLPAERLPICDLPGRIAPAALPEAWLRAEANTRGALACDIARHGVLLAGEWTPPPLEDAPRMSAHHYGRGTVQAAGELDTGLTALARIDGRSLMADECACERFERGTSDMARLLARAVLHRRGVDFQPTPDLSVLGQAAAEAGQVALGETLKAMNGGPKRPRNAPWWEDGLPDVGAATRRLGLALRLWPEELADALGDDDPELAAVARVCAAALARRLALLAAELRAAPEPGEGVRLSDLVAEALTCRRALPALLDEAGAACAALGGPAEPG